MSENGGRATDPAEQRFGDIAVSDLGDDLWMIRFERPDRLNAVNQDTLRSLCDVLELLGTMLSRPRAVIITGAGRAFCAGAAVDADGGVDFGDVEPGNAAVRAIRALPCPVIAAVKGPVVGVGFSIALACDFVLAAENAFFLAAFAAVGLVPDSGMTALLTEIVGRTRALEIMMLAERIPAEQARDWGMVNRVVPAASFDGVVLDFARRLAAGPTRSYAHTKLIVGGLNQERLDRAFAAEAAGQRALSVSNDFAEGRAAFLEKRTPRFLGS